MATEGEDGLRQEIERLREELAREKGKAVEMERWGRHMEKSAIAFARSIAEYANTWIDGALRDSPFREPLGDLPVQGDEGGAELGGQ